MSLVIRSPWMLSRHAFARMVEMGLTRPEVIAIVEDPDVDYPTPVTVHPCARTASNSRYAVGYDPVDRMIITVLYHGEEYERSRLSWTEAVRIMRESVGLSR